MREIWLEIADAEKDLNNALSTLRQHGTEYADKERRYRMAKAKKILMLKQEGMPVTLIPDLVKGDEDISLLAFNRDVAEVTYKANKDALSVKMLELSMLKSQYEKEYVATK